MAIYHCHVKVISRTTGRSSSGAAAYRSGEKIKDEKTGMTHDYTRKSGVVHTEIMIAENIPERLRDRETLWNEIEFVEKRKDAQLAREIEMALPVELDRKKQVELVRDFVQGNFTSEGMIADIAIHDKNDGNPHAHVMLTMRKFDAEKGGFANKDRTWNAVEKLAQWREAWELSVNRALELAGRVERVDRRSLEEQGISRRAQIHEGKSPQRKAVNAEIMLDNEILAVLESELAALNVRLPEPQERSRTPPDEKRIAGTVNSTPKTKGALKTPFSIVSGQKIQGDVTVLSPGEVVQQLATLEKKRREGASNLARPVIEQLVAGTTARCEELTQEANTWATDREKIRSNPPIISFWSRLTGKAEKLKKQWDQRVERLLEQEKSVLKNIEKLKSDTEEQKNKLLVDGEKEYDEQNPQEALRIQQLREQKAENDEIARLEGVIEDRYIPGSAGFRGQLNGAVKLHEIELRRGFTDEEIRKKRPRLDEVLKKGEAYDLERKRGRSR